MNFLTEDFKDFLNLLQKNNIKFLICGGHAVGYHGYPRLTRVFDLLFEPTEENADKIMKTLHEFGFGFGNIGISKKVFSSEGSAITLGVQPNQIDLLTSVSEVKTSEIFQRAVKGKLEEFDVLFISKEDLIKCKKSAGRLKDLADIEELEKIK